MKENVSGCFFLNTVYNDSQQTSTRSVLTEIKTAFLIKLYQIETVFFCES